MTNPGREPAYILKIVRLLRIQACAYRTRRHDGWTEARSWALYDR